MSKIRWNYLLNEIKDNCQFFFFCYFFLYVYLFFSIPVMVELFIERCSKLSLLLFPFIVGIVFPTVAEFWEVYHVKSYSLFIWLYPDMFYYVFIAGIKCVRYVEKKEMVFYRDGVCIFSIDKKTYYEWADVFRNQIEWTCGADIVKPVLPDPPDDVPLW